MAHTEIHDLPPADSFGGSPVCLSCGGETQIRDHLPQLWHKPVGSQSYDIRWCEPCDFGFLDPRPCKEEHARLVASLVK